MDLEFWDSHSGFYSRCFRQYPVECSRLHFFSSGSLDDIASGDGTEIGRKLIDLLQRGKSWPDIKESHPALSYRGYCVLRPTSSFVVSRTAIAFDARPASTLPGAVEPVPEETGTTPYLRVHQACCAHLMNATLPVETPEFIQQDPNLGTCGTASLWVATRSIAAMARPPYAAITRQANDMPQTEHQHALIYDPKGPEAGLTDAEIRRVLAQQGARPFYAESASETIESETARLNYTIFSFVDSQVPVLLCLQETLDPCQEIDGHVVAAVGFAIPSRPSLDDCQRASVFLGVSDRNLLASSAINLYYAHDDSYGPFNRVAIHLSPPDDGGVKKVIGSVWRRVKGVFLRHHADDPGNSNAVTFSNPRITRGGKDRRSSYLSCVVAPIPPDVRQGPMSSLEASITEFEVTWKELSMAGDYVYLWRSVLAAGADFKRSLARRRYPESIRAWYGTLHLPKYVWVHELSIIETTQLSEQFWSDEGRSIDGEFLYDATAPDSDLFWLSTRLGGACFDHRNDESLLPPIEELEFQMSCFDPSLDGLNHRFAE